MLTNESLHDRNLKHKCVSVCVCHISNELFVDLILVGECFSLFAAQYPICVWFFVVVVCAVVCLVDRYTMRPANSFNRAMDRCFC